jgi:hypothetical protein
MRKFAGLLMAVYGCACLAGDLPDPTLTQGAINPDLTAEKLCAKGFTTKDYRATSEATKRAVCRAYGLDDHCYGADKAEIDHLASLELGGADVQANLWPQSYTGTWNAHIKDRYENFLHKRVCAGKITLDQAQHEIMTDWIAGYESHPELPLPEQK